MRIRISKRNTFTIIFCLMILTGLMAQNSVFTLTAASTATTSKTVGRTLYVGGTGPNNYTNIQDAVNNSLNGDTIFVYSGTYDENVDMNKEITIKGEQENTTFINGYIWIYKNNTRVSNFTPARVISYGSNIIIDNCTFKTTNGGTAISIRENNTVVENCTITGHWSQGIDCADHWLYSTYPKSNITIRRCLIENTSGGWLPESSGIRNLRNGIIIENSFINNELSLYNVRNCIIFHNNFLYKYYKDVRSVSDNLWNSTYPMGGNYWKHYNGVDNFSGEEQNISGSDGIGDTAHAVVDTDPVEYDYYPLMNMYCPWDITPPEITIISPENNTIMRTGEINVQINVYDIHFRNMSYRINNNELIITKENSLFFNTAEWTQDGFYNITLDAVDYNNNRALGFYSFNVDNTAPGTPGKPIYENDEPGSNIDRDGEIVFYWAPSQDANIDVYEVWLSINNNYTQVFSTPYNYTTINGTTGNNYTIAVVAKDKVGLKSTQSPISDTITVNITIILPEIKIQEINQTIVNNTFKIHWNIIAGSPTSFEISTDTGETWTDIGNVTQHTFTLNIGENTLFVRGKTNQHTGPYDSITITRTNNTHMDNNETGINNETEQHTPFPLTTTIAGGIIGVIIIIAIAVFIICRKNKRTKGGLKDA